ncbi:MAG: hypothetical protein IIW54_01010 [Lachnospiraceae bacterium]|nr:hypothetical protein [Lachnospiraceae bacterium]
MKYITNFSLIYTQNTMVRTDTTQTTVTYCMNYNGNSNIYIVEADFCDSVVNRMRWHPIFLHK